MNIGPFLFQPADSIFAAEAVGFGVHDGQAVSGKVLMGNCVVAEDFTGRRDAGTPRESLRFRGDIRRGGIQVLAVGQVEREKALLAHRDGSTGWIRFE